MQRDFDNVTNVLTHSTALTVVFGHIDFDLGVVKRENLDFCFGLVNVFVWIKH